jgi:hypothetical protein
MSTGDNVRISDCFDEVVVLLVYLGQDFILVIDGDTFTEDAFYFQGVFSFVEVVDEQFEWEQTSCLPDFLHSQSFTYSSRCLFTAFFSYLEASKMEDLNMFCLGLPESSLSCVSLLIVEV